MSKEKIEFVRSSGNVFADLGLPDPEEHLAKAKLAHAIATTIKGRGLSQTKAAALIGETQPNVSNILRGKLKDFSRERLIKHLIALGKNVTITVEDAGATTGAGGVHVRVLGKGQVTAILTHKQPSVKKLQVAVQKPQVHKGGLVEQVPYGQPAVAAQRPAPKPKPAQPGRIPVTSATGKRKK